MKTSEYIFKLAGDHFFSAGVLAALGVACSGVSYILEKTNHPMAATIFILPTLLLLIISLVELINGIDSRRRAIHLAHQEEIVERNLKSQEQNKCKEQSVLDQPCTHCGGLMRRTLLESWCAECGFISNVHGCGWAYNGDEEDLRDTPHGMCNYYNQNGHELLIYYKNLPALNHELLHALIEISAILPMPINRDTGEAF